MGKVNSWVSTRSHQRLIALVAINALVMVFTVWSYSVNYHTSHLGLLDEPAIAAHDIFNGWTGDYPTARVIVWSNDTDQILGDNPKYFTAGAYDPKDQVITLTDRYFTATPEQQTQILVHEYGHALMGDLINHGSITNNYSLNRYSINRVQLFTQEANPRSVPEILRPLFLEYQRAERDTYDKWSNPPGYYTNIFGEYFAESFRCYIQGETVSEEVKAYFQEIEQLEQL